MLRVERIQVPSGGTNVTAAPDHVSNKQAPRVENFLVHRDGKLPLRGGFLSYQADALFTSSAVAGAWTTLDPYVSVPTVLLTKWQDTTLPIRLNRWAQRMGTIADFAISTTIHKVHAAQAVGGASTFVASNADLVPGHQCTEGRDGNNEAVYGIAAYNSTKLSLDRIMATKIVKWDPSASGAGSLTEVANAPRACIDITWYQDRLFVLGGTPADNPLGQVDAIALYWTDPGGPTGTLASWQDDVSGLTNKIRVPGATAADNCRGLARIRDGLVIFTGKSLHVMRGSGPSSWTIKQVTSEVGVTDPRTIVEYNEGVFFLSDRGLMYFDGVDLFNVSDDIRALLGDLRPYVDTTGISAWAAALGNDYIMLTVANPADGTLRFCGIYHVGARAWSIISVHSSVMPLGAPLVPFRAGVDAFVFDGRRVFQTLAVTDPDRVTDPKYRAFDGWGTSGRAVPGKWHSRLFRLGSPGNEAKLQRLFMDFKWERANADQDLGNGPTVTVVNAVLDPPAAQIQLRTEEYGEESRAYRYRQVNEVFAEVSEMQLRVEWADDTTTPFEVGRAELFDGAVEFQVAAQRSPASA